MTGRCILVVLAFYMIKSHESMILTYHPDGTCVGNLDVRNDFDKLKQLRGCRVLEGFVHLFSITNIPVNASEPFAVSHELREITQYLLVYNVFDGITSLRQIFPNLAVIHGETLKDDYALVIFDNGLEEVGLDSLIKIKRGGVRIQKNEFLCCNSASHWEMMTDGIENIVSNNGPANCTSDACDRGKKQQVMNCHRLCVGGCSDPSPSGCNFCGGVLLQGQCLDECPRDMYEVAGRRCLTEIECRQEQVQLFWEDDDSIRNRIPFNGTCRRDCPGGYYKAENGTCVEGLKKICSYENAVQALSDVQSFTGCQIIEGPLIINLLSKGSAVMEELRLGFGMVEEITGYLVIYGSSHITSLNFFQNLRIIHGESSEKNENSSFTVVYNARLQELWDSPDGFKQLQILRGTAEINKNPMLCSSHVLEFMKAHGFKYELDLNKRCSIVNMTASFHVHNSSTVEIRWPSLRAKEIISSYGNSFFGYTVHYKEATSTETNENSEETDVCGDYWNTDLVAQTGELDMKYHITGLKPDTEYIFYVKTYLLYMSGLDRKSPVYTFRTSADRPSMPRNFKVTPISSSDLLLEWIPPLYPNGIITRYVAVVLLIPDTLSGRNYCKEPLTTVNMTREDEDSFICDDRSCCPSIQTSQLSSLFHGNPISNDLTICRWDNPFTTVLHSNSFQGGFEEKLYSAINETGLEINFSSQRVLEFDGNKTSATVSKLLKFRKYLVKLAACGNFHQCSPFSYAVIRTMKGSSSDDIVKTEDIDVNNYLNEQVQISWKHPELPNSILLAYDIILHHTDGNNISACVPILPSTGSIMSYTVNNLASGEYSLQLGSITLAGKSPLSGIKQFIVPSKYVPGDFLAVALVVPIVLLLLSAVLVVMLFRILKKNRDNMMETLMNPYYVSGCTYVKDEWEIPKERLQLIREINQGSFGHVFEGLLKPDNILCAVKIQREDVSQREQLEFLTEASVMKAFADGYHVVKLLGVISESRPPMVIMELMSRGDLKAFLRNSRDNESLLPLTRVLRMAAEIADGMAYLEDKKFVHRDLAARNCMVAEDMTIKIGDFGMTRDVYQSDYYRKSDKGLMPVRWMSPESLNDGIFTSQSDVWSYGIVLWEITSLAEQPYQGMGNEEVLRFVQQGGTLIKPPKCPSVLFDLMKVCWLHRPSHRPTFMQIVNYLEDYVYLDDSFQKISFYFSKKGESVRSRPDFKKYDETLLLYSFTSDSDFAEPDTHGGLYLNMPLLPKRMYDIASDDNEYVLPDK